MMSIPAAEFRRILGHLPTGVTVIAARDEDGGEPYGLTANAVTSLSLDPPLMLACVDRGSDTHDRIRAAKAFAINVLAEGQAELSRQFSGKDAATKFAGVLWHRRVTGSPVLAGVVAWLDCRLWAEYPGGDHTIFVGEVVAAEAPGGEPLIFHGGAYRRLT